MHTLSEIINNCPHIPNNEIYIIGTGPSARLFPISFLRNKFSIGLNEAWRLFSPEFGPTLSISIHPNCIPENLDVSNTTWITKVKKSESNWQKHERNNNLKRFYFFENVDDISLLKQSSQNENRIIEDSRLYCGRGIQTAAMHLACLLLKASGSIAHIILVGVDCAALGHKDQLQHHAFNTVINPHQFTINEVYDEYYYYTVLCREILEEQYKIKFLTLSTLIGEKDKDRDYIRQLEKNNIQSLPEPKVIKDNNRTTKLVRDYIEH